MPVATQQPQLHPSAAQGAQTYNVDQFNAGDVLYFKDSATSDYAITHQTVSGGATTITLSDQTRIVIQGTTATIGGGSFSHG